LLKAVGAVRVELDRLVVVLDGAVVLAFDSVGVAAIVEGVGIIWTELDRLIEVLDGLVTFSPHAVNEAAIG